MSNSFFTVGSDQTLTAALSGERIETAPTSISASIKSSVPLSLDPATGQVTAQQNQSTNTADNTIITSESGSARAVATLPTDLIQFKGMTIRVDQMEKMGLMQKTASGNYEMVPESDKAAPAQQEQAAEPADVHDAFELNNAEADSSNQFIPASLSDNPAVMNSITTRAMDAAITGDFKSTIAAFSQSTGQSPTEAAASIDGATKGFQQAADRYMSSVIKMPSEDLPAFYEYCRTQQPQELRSAIDQIVNRNSFRSLGKMVNGFAKANPPSPAALTKAGYQVTMGSDGQALITIQGKQISVISAARAGLI